MQSKNGNNFYKLTKLMESEENIRLAYRNIKKNMGSHTAGVDGKTIADIEDLTVEEVVTKIREMFKWYEPEKVRRVYIPKPDGRKRPLGIPAIWDRLFQQCILQILEPICEAKFHPHSYGFRISLYGKGYITWAIRNHGGYSEANALQFSQEQAASHGWARYGDPEYVPHVLRYYSGGNLFAGFFGNDQIVWIAKAQLGNEGGQKFWSWYGFQGRVEWCACFVSWCADQSGLISSGSVLKFSYCPTGAEWFKSQWKWQDRGYTPTPGNIIFFDWATNGGPGGTSDHVGIVEKCENGVVYTIEGNSGDAVRQKSYDVNSSSIMGYGILT